MIRHHYSRLPDSVLLDPRLSTGAKCVYSYLAGCLHRGRLVVVGQRLLASELSIALGTVNSALLELEKYGHISISKGEPGRRSAYTLNHPLFGGDMKAESLEKQLPSSPPLVSVPVTPRVRLQIEDLCSRRGGITPEVLIHRLLQEAYEDMNDEKG